MKTYDPHESEKEIKQADNRQMSMRVLIISMFVLVVLFGLIYFLFFAGGPPPAQQIN